jgi:hypothetical protein
MSPIPLSQTEENIGWRRWLGQSTASLITDETAGGGRLSPKGARISPGISERRAEREWSQTLSALTDITPIEVGEEDFGETRGPDVPSSSEFSQMLNQYYEITSGLFESHEEFDLEVPHAQLQDSRVTDPETDTTRGGAVCLTSPAIPRVPVEREAAPDEAWKQFVFGDDNTDEFLEQAFKKATQDAARNLQPSDCSTCVAEEPLSEWDSVFAVPGSPFSGLFAAPDTADGDLSSAVVSASREATLAPSSAELLSNLTPSSPHATSQPSRIVAEAGSSMSPGVGCSTNHDGDPWSDVSMRLESIGQEPLSDHTSGVPSVVPSAVTSMAVEPAQSVAGGNELQFRFAPPKLFVGSRSIPNQVTRRTGAAVPLSFERKRKGRSKKRAPDGRADIRALPNYTDDPIEEIEDGDASQPSLFGALEFV